MSTLDIEGIKALLATHANPSTALHLDAASETNIDEMLRHVKRAAEEAAIPLLAAMVAEVEALRKELKNTRELCAINGEVADDALDEAERLCDRFGLLHRGQLRYEGTLPELRQQTGKTSIVEMFIDLLRSPAVTGATE